MSNRNPEGQPDFEHIDRLVGPLNPEHKEEAVELAEGKIELQEVEKTERDLAIMQMTEKAVDELMRRYGRDKIVTLPPENVRLIAPAAEIGGFYDARKRQLVVEKKPGREASFAANLFHEMMHAKSFNALKVKDETITYWRTGLEAIAADGKPRFRQLNEAIVQTTTLRFYDEQVQKDPSFAKDILNAQMMGKDPREQEEITYMNERLRLADIVTAIAAVEGRPYAEVEDIFIRASVTGDAAELAATVEKTWGSGSFRLLGESLGDFWRQKISKEKPSVRFIDKFAGKLKKLCSSHFEDEAANGDSLAGKLLRKLKKAI